MILVRAPLRVSFVGGGTDLPEFYQRSPGRVISTTIDKFVFIALNATPMIDKISVRYSVSETVSTPEELHHTRIRAALLDLGIRNNLEIGSFASLPARTGLGSSSSFSVALMKGLYAHKGQIIDRRAAAEAACRLEMDLLGEPVGKQDQYAAAFGGWNIFQFNPDGSVDVEPVMLHYQTRAKLESYLMLFFTGITRDASSVLGEQRAHIAEKFGMYEAMAASVYEFRERLMAGDVRGMGSMLHEGWMRKKKLASVVSSSLLDTMYEAAMNDGALGGKVLGAGAGGCLLFVVDPSRQASIASRLSKIAVDHGLTDARSIHFHSIHTGTDILFNDQR